MSVMWVGAAATVVGAGLSANAASKGAKAQAAAAGQAADASLQAARETNELQKQIYDQNRTDNEPWRQAGQNALAGLASYKAPEAKNLADLSTFGNTKIGDQARAPDVASWYTGALGRQADQSGLAYWESRLDNAANPDAVYQEFIASAKNNGEQVDPTLVDWRQTSKPTYADPRLADVAFTNARISDPDSAYANTDIGSKLSEYRNPDFGMDGFASTNIKDADSAYAAPTLKNLVRDFQMSDFQADPGYQYRLEQGGRALENSAASRGMQLSGATLKALTRFGQNEGSNEFDRSFNRYRTQKLDQYGQAVDDFGRTEGQRREKYGQRMDEYSLNEAQRAAKYGIAVDGYNRADKQRIDQYGQRVDKFGRDEAQRIDKYGQRVDEFGRLEGQRQEQYQQRVGDYGRTEDQRADKYAQRTDQYNRDENQRINQHNLLRDQYDRDLSVEARDYNRLASLANVGQQTNAANAASGNTYASQVSANTNNATTNANNARMGGANAAAAGYVGVANAVNSGLGQYMNYNQNQNLLKALADRPRPVDNHLF